MWAEHNVSEVLTFELKMSAMWGSPPSIWGAAHIHYLLKMCYGNNVILYDFEKKLNVWEWVCYAGMRTEERYPERTLLPVTEPIIIRTILPVQIRYYNNGLVLIV